METLIIDRIGKYKASADQVLAFQRQVAENIKTWKRRFGYTSEYVAQQIGVSVDVVRKWEQGVNFPRPSALCSLALLYGVKVSDIVDGNGTAEI